MLIDHFVSLLMYQFSESTGDLSKAAAHYEVNLKNLHNLNILQKCI